MLGTDTVRRSHTGHVLLAGLLTVSAPGVLHASGPDDAPANAPAAAQAPVQKARGLLDNLSLFVGPDGSKQPQDLGINANMGIRASANWAFPLLERLNIGAQVGAGVNVSDAAVHVLDQIEGTSRRTQTFATFGVFQKDLAKLNWGLAYDAQIQQYYDDFQLGQLRGQAGYALASQDEVGVWFTKGLKGDNGHMAGAQVRVDPIGQVNVYTRHTWSSGAQTTVWVGVANGHSNVVWVLPDEQRNNRVLVYGSELNLPLDERFSITGAANFITPTATGTVDAFLGLTFYPRRGGARASFAPLTTVANNPSFAVNLQR